MHKNGALRDRIYDAQKRALNIHVTKEGARNVATHKEKAGDGARLGTVQSCSTHQLAKSRHVSLEPT